MPSKWEMALQALHLLLQPMHLLVLVFGVLLGLSVGVIPGLGGVVAMAMLIPFTYTMDAPSSFALLIGVAAVSTVSDVIPAVLFGVPGTVGAAATVIDGHAMGKQGKAGQAFGAAFAAATFGGLFGALVLVLMIPVLQPIMLSIGSPELLAFSIFGLSMVATLSGRAPLKGLTVAGLGLMLSQIGAGTQTGTLRWTFDWLYLFDGIPLVPLTLGLFALPELADLAIHRRKIAGENAGQLNMSNQWEGVREVFRHWWLVLRCSAMGTVLGMVPGVGGAVIDWIVYGYAVRTEKNPERFGTGDIRGVIAPESSNNAKEGGQLLPTIAFGVPAGAGMTLLLGAFLLHGLTPGPDMLTKNLDITYSIAWSLTLAHVLGACIVLCFARQLARFAEIRHSILLPLIMPVLFVAAFEGSRSWGDLYFLFAFGLLGWILKTLGWPRPPMVLGFVVGPMFARYLFLSEEIYGNAWIYRPVVLVIAALIVWALFRPLQKTVVQLAHEFTHLNRAHLRFTPSARLASIVILFIVAALITSADWPDAEKIVPRTACWFALIVASLTLISELFGAAPDAKPSHADAAAPPPIAPNLLRARAAQYFGWAAGFILLVSLIGFIPAIGTFVFLYMCVGFRERWYTAAGLGLAATLFCYALFDRGLSVPWPQAVLGDLVPSLRDMSGLL